MTTRKITVAKRLDRLDTMIAEGRLIRHAWTDGEDRACLLAALAPECGEAQSSDACPARLMPRWLAELTPAFDDSGTAAAWPGMVRRYASLARRWHVLNAAAWRRLDYTARAIGVRATVFDRERYPEVGAAVDAVLALHEQEIAGVHVESAAWSAAESAAWSAAGSAAWDRITSATLDAIERECAKSEAAR